MTCKYFLPLHGWTSSPNGLRKVYSLMKYHLSFVGFPSKVCLYYYNWKLCLTSHCEDFLRFLQMFCSCICRSRLHTELRYLCKVKSLSFIFVYRFQLSHCYVWGIHRMSYSLEKVFHWLSTHCEKNYQSVGSVHVSPVFPIPFSWFFSTSVACCFDHYSFVNL